MRQILTTLLLACLLPACTTNPVNIDALQGSWVVATGEHEGKPMDVVVGGALTVAGENFRIRTASGAELTGQLHVDARRHPAQVDFVHDSGTHWLAIYAVQDGTLRLNYVDATGKEPRPIQFVTSSTTEASLLTLRRTATTP